LVDWTVNVPSAGVLLMLVMCTGEAPSLVTVALAVLV
jgi:hypothetical protein